MSTSFTRYLQYDVGSTKLFAHFFLSYAHHSTRKVEQNAAPGVSFDIDSFIAYYTSKILHCSLNGVIA